MEKRRICILLTGTIEPIQVPDLKRTDPVERERDYYHSVRKWMSLGYPVVFVENSGFDSDNISELFIGKNEHEYHKFVSKISHLGKGHGEAEIINYAFAKSDIVKSSDIIIKSSGRQFIKNSLLIVPGIHIGNTYVIGWLKRRLQYADSRFFIAQKKFFTNYLLKEFNVLSEKDNIYFEHVLARAIHRCMADGKIWSLPKEYPICEGISGTENKKYKSTLFSRIKGNLIIKITDRMLRNDYL